VYSPFLTGQYGYFSWPIKIFLDSKISIALGVEVIRCQVVLKMHFCWDIPTIARHVLVNLHGGSQEEV